MAQGSSDRPFNESIALVLLFVSVSLGLVMQTIPRDLIASSQSYDGLRPGLALTAFRIMSFVQSILWLALIVILPLLAVPRGAGRVGWLVGFGGSVAFGLMTFTGLWVQIRLNADLSFAPIAALAEPLLSFGRALDLLPHLTLAAALSLRFRNAPNRALGLAAVGAAGVAVALHPLRPWHPGPIAGIVLLVAMLSLFLWRKARIPRRALPWLLPLLALWVLPWLILVLPDLGKAFAISSVSARFEAVWAAFEAPRTVHHVAHAANTILIVGILVAISQRGPVYRRDWWLAGAIALATGLQEVVLQLGGFPAPPLAALEMMRSGVTGLAGTLLGVVAWAGALALPFLTTLAAASLLLTHKRPQAVLAQPA